MKKNDSIDPSVKKANAKIQKWIALGDQSADLDLSSLTSAVGLTLPTNVGGCLNLNGLTSAEGLKLPKSVGGDLDLSSLTSAVGLTLPTNVGGCLILIGLTSAEGLKLPKNVGSLYPGLGVLVGLRSAVGQQREIEPPPLSPGLSQADGLKLPTLVRSKKQTLATKSEPKQYVISVYGRVRRTTIGALTANVAKLLKKKKPDDDEDLREYVEDLDDAFFAYAVSSEVFTISVTEVGQPDVIYTTNQDDQKLKMDIKEFQVEEPGIYVTTTQNERGEIGSYHLTLEIGKKFEPALLSIVGVSPNDTVAGPLITEVQYNSLPLNKDENYETDVKAFQVNFFEVESVKDGVQNRCSLDIKSAIAKLKK